MLSVPSLFPKRKLHSYFPTTWGRHRWTTVGTLFKGLCMWHLNTVGCTVCNSFMNKLEVYTKIERTITEVWENTIIMSSFFFSSVISTMFFSNKYVISVSASENRGCMLFRYTLCPEADIHKLLSIQIRFLLANCTQQALINRH